MPIGRPFLLRPIGATVDGRYTWPTGVVQRRASKYTFGSPLTQSGLSPFGSARWRKGGTTHTGSNMISYWSKNVLHALQSFSRSRLASCQSEWLARYWERQAQQKVASASDLRPTQGRSQVAQTDPRRSVRQMPVYRQPSS